MYSIFLNLEVLNCNQGYHKLRETQGILIYFFNSVKLREVLIFSKIFREVLRFLKSQENFLLD